jgi:hypothetical protein
MIEGVAPNGKRSPDAEAGGRVVEGDVVERGGCASCGTDKVMAWSPVVVQGADWEQSPSVERSSYRVGARAGNNRNAGKRRARRAHERSRWLCHRLSQAARAASHTKATPLARGSVADWRPDEAPGTQPSPSLATFCWSPADGAIRKYRCTGNSLVVTYRPFGAPYGGSPEPSLSRAVLCKRSKRGRGRQG